MSGEWTIDAAACDCGWSGTTEAQARAHAKELGHEPIVCGSRTIKRTSRLSPMTRTWPDDTL